MRKLSILIVSLTLLACGGGGGGGGGGDTFYGGVWRFVGSKQVDDCNLGLPNTTRHTHTVNQDGDRVVLDSGSAVFTGSVDRERDGFLVETSRLSGGCAVASAFSYQDASDGEAGVGFAIVTTCGSLTCTTAWGGPSTRDGRSASASEEVLALEELQTELTPEGVPVRSEVAVSPEVAQAIERAKAAL
jgi:hypothetical protein